MALVKRSILWAMGRSELDLWFRTAFYPDGIGYDIKYLTWLLAMCFRNVLWLKQPVLKDKIVEGGKIL